MISTADLLRLARAYADHQVVNLTTVSSRVFNDGKKLDAIAAGGDLYSRRLRRSIVWFSENWPEGLDWPGDIPRPDPDHRDEEVAA